MKKILLSAFALFAVMTAFADVEIGTAENVSPTLYASSDDANADGATAFSPTFCKGEIVTWTGGEDCWYSTGTSSVEINGTEVSFKKGAAGVNNPQIGTSIVNGTTTGLPDSGTYYQFKVTQNGYLYILGKFDTSKHYVAWEESNRIPYVFAGYDSKLKQVLTCDMSEKATLDANGYIDESFEIDTIWKYVGIERSETGSIEAGVVRIAVKADKTYTFCGTGTKVAISAYCFAPEEESVEITHSGNTLIDETVPTSSTEEGNGNDDNNVGNDDGNNDDSGNSEGGTTTTTSYECYFTADGPSSSFYTVNSGASYKSGSGITYNDESYSYYLLMESSTQISFTAPNDGSLTLVYGTDKSGYNIYLDDKTNTSNKYKGEAVTDDEGNTLYYVLTISITAGEHTLYKADAAALYYMCLSVTTGINAVSLQTTGNNIYYNLNGQRVSNPTKGIYILNGKKVLVK
ncbi:MAG: hypothetical protein LUC88_07540 [Prevotella sp.]|nr:hypothetical protein [Prevotella sp.]